MEMHHKLRRDPAWPSNACNLCGQVGHQAAQCTNGTINWKGIYGEDAFVLKEPLYHSDYSRIAKEKQVDLTALEARARQYAKEKCTAAGMDYDEVVTQAVVWQGAVTAAGDTASAAPVTQDAEDKPSAGDAQESLPEGWSEAKDQQQRTYYWHTKTKKVQWERPTAATPA
ncbi:hypothetical protein ABBQ32_001983 [Trebouxia sp. C0010 RCD-2024]